jgi:vacuolar-type H+-ATPase subunit H
VRSDIINDVLSVEDRAQQIIRDAEHSARDIISAAQSTANELIRSSVKEGRDRLRALQEQAETEARAEVEEYEESLNISSNISGETLDTIAHAIVEQVCKTDFDAFLEHK